MKGIHPTIDNLNVNAGSDIIGKTSRVGRLQMKGMRGLAGLVALFSLLPLLLISCDSSDVDNSAIVTNENDSAAATEEDSAAATEAKDSALVTEEKCDRVREILNGTEEEGYPDFPDDIEAVMGSPPTDFASNSEGTREIYVWADDRSSLEIIFSLYEGELSRHNYHCSYDIPL